jgi:MFS family permease
MRKILSIILGALAAMLIVSAVGYLYPIPDLESDDPAALAAVVGSMTVTAKLLVAGGWFMGALAGAWLALRISDWRMAAWIVVLVVLAGGIVNIVSLPHPFWMQACAVLLPVAGGVLGIRVHRKPYPGEPLLG